MIGAPGRLNMDNEGIRFGVKIAATDPDHGIVRFLVQPRTLLRWTLLRWTLLR